MAGCKETARYIPYNGGNEGGAMMIARSRIRFTALPVLLTLFALAGCGGGTVAPTVAITPIPASAPTSAAPVAAKVNFAPEFAIPSPEQWYNSQPLTLAALRGKPVLLVFWSDI